MPTVLMHGAPVRLACAPTLPCLGPQLHQIWAGDASRDQGLIVIGKKLNKQCPGQGYQERNICLIPAHFTTSVVGAIGSYQSISPHSQLLQSSDDGGITPVSQHTSWSGIQSYTTGISTEQSSICSWRDDEFDRANTQLVCQLFSDVDELLYEGKVSSRTQALQEECKEWNGHSPHLRILGNQLEVPKQEGFQYFHRIGTSARSAHLPPTQDDGNDTRELCIEGHQLVPTPCVLHSVVSDRHTLKDPSVSSIFEEEVYEVEGKIEEFFAFDVKETDDEGVDHRKVCVTMRGGVPPVSPHACIKDAVAGEMFDDVWREVVHMLEAELLHKHWESEPADGVTHMGTSEDSSKVGCDPSSHILTKTFSSPASRGSDSRSLSLWPNIIPRQASRVSSAFKSSLNGVMTIQAKPLQQRQHGFPDKSQCDPEDRPGMLMLTGRGQTRLMEQSFLSTARGTCASSRRPQAQHKLPKLSAETRPYRSNGVLRGTKLSTVTEGLTSPSVSAVLKQRFPPIHSETLEQELSVSASRQMQPRGRVLQSRVVSAVQPVSSLPPLREPTLLLEPLPRPNTTHTFWSDTPIKRSFTPMDFTCHMRSGRGPITGERSHIGVTGFSVGITCSTANSLSECAGTQRRQPINPLSSEGEEGAGQLPLGTHHQRKAFSRIPNQGKKKLQVV
ncbi:protein FAM149A [Megalops cyprinoides]|uniref:protein FAM149A n=1 Tax=Megalops cyprinoides TaxID=118141 RepID=UPI001863DB86|nr:protein FAM149A [Megalops cyprinoides]